MDPTCPICCETLGQRGGPSTLPCGHNGCLECLQTVQQLRSECPLCRAPFEKNLPLALNTQLRDLIDELTKTRSGIDAENGEAEWETFPTALSTTQDYSLELMRRSIMEAAPSAPPRYDDADITELTPPKWMPDSSSSNCIGCSKPFQPLMRRRHHCRLCGRLFCHDCSQQQHLLPPKFTEMDPQRVCNMCADVLRPWQGIFYDLQPRFDQLPVQDAFDWCSLRSWINPPLSQNMECDIYKATNILKTFHKLVLSVPGVISEDFLNSTEGIVILSEVKVAFGVSSCRFGTGIVLSRVGSERQWGRPCSLSSISFGAGLQFGGQLMDTVILLSTPESINAFTGEKQIGLSGGVSASLGMGPGLQHSLTIRVGRGEGGRVAKAMGFCLCRGAFIGASLDGTLLSVRSRLNQTFYGASLTPKQLLTENVPAPRAATHLVLQLEDLCSSHHLACCIGKGPSILVAS